MSGPTAVTGHYDESPQAWRLRDVDVRALARRMAEGSDRSDVLRASDAEALLGYLALAADASQTRRLVQWARLVGEAFEKRRAAAAAPTASVSGGAR